MWGYVGSPSGVLGWGCRGWESRGLGSTLSCFTDFGFGFVLPLRSGNQRQMGQVTVKRSSVPQWFLHDTYANSELWGSTLWSTLWVSSLWGSTVSGYDFGFDRVRISGGLLFGSLMSRGLLSRANDFGYDRADACQ